jgi:hypothetical protein
VSLTGWLADDWAAASNALTSHPCYFEGTQRASAPWTYILLSTLLVVRTLTPSGIILDQDPITKREITPAKKCRFGDTTVTGTGTEISQRPDRPAFTSKAQTPHFIMKWWWGGSGLSIRRQHTRRTARLGGRAHVPGHDLHSERCWRGTVQVHAARPRRQAGRQWTCWPMVTVASVKPEPSHRAILCTEGPWRETAQTRLSCNSG